MQEGQFISGGLSVILWFLFLLSLVMSTWAAQFVLLLMMGVVLHVINTIIWSVLILTHRVYSLTIWLRIHLMTSFLLGCLFVWLIVNIELSNYDDIGDLLFWISPSLLIPLSAIGYYQAPKSVSVNQEKGKIKDFEKELKKSIITILGRPTQRLKQDQELIHEKFHEFSNTNPGDWRRFVDLIAHLKENPSSHHQQNFSWLVEAIDTYQNA